ncbi:hypothetical protein BMS3Abin07_01981 [bacterium BMS3Abin07]|nr:hypothetical protein BMS3Abin07_01981 [bacterium BMS3Abin07]
MKTKGFLKIFLLGIAVLVITGTVAFAAGNIKAVGVLTSVEDDGSVIIDGRGFNVDPLVSVLDSEGKEISMDELAPPTRVQYEYGNTKDGPVLRIIRVIAQ